MAMNIIVYTKKGCPWCRGVIDFLNEKKIGFEEREVRENPKYMEEMVAKSGQDKAPTLDIDGKILADSEKEQVETYLRDKGIV